MQLQINMKDDQNNTSNIASDVDLKNATIEFKESNAAISIDSGSKVIGAKFILGKGSRITIGKNSNFGGLIVVGAYSSVTIGDNLSVTKNMFIRAVEATKVTIGNDVLIATDVVVRTTDGHVINDRTTRTRLNPSKDVIISDHVWIADRAVILKGVEIGSASVVAFGSIVTKSVPSNCIVAGAPAKIVKRDIVWEHAPGQFNDQYYL